MTDLDKLIEAVEAGRYDRESGVPKYYDFGNDSAGIVPGTRMDRMSLYIGGRCVALDRLKALRANHDHAR